MTVIVRRLSGIDDDTHYPADIDAVRLIAGTYRGAPCEYITTPLVTMCGRSLRGLAIATTGYASCDECREGL